MVLSCNEAILEVVFPNPVVSDNCPGPIAITFDPPSGTALPVGPTTVNVTATDAADNTASCGFLVTVNVRTGFTIVPAVLITWDCGVLQESIDLQNWNDLPDAVSPFAAATKLIPKNYWRVRR